ncbi:hypothetical protein JG687_00010018 [Phytophthora cactorum]|uniref:Uncharacterized protein n=1 Tax=Phytophthora cactorum TaxID=29920 RepID=A0A8T1U9M1_9STRA|nr:hypothetical protein JG687_00010018 [Phytophthora cactorum]
MEPTDELFTLLLSFGHTKKSIGENGVRALQGVDSARFGVLEEANALVPADKKPMAGSPVESLKSTWAITGRSKILRTRDSRLLRGLFINTWQMWQSSCPWILLSKKWLLNFL